jgi:catechol O-methyltransferase
MLFLAFFQLERISDADVVFNAARSCGISIGASGFSAVLMTGEQGEDAERETRLQLALADEAQDERMRAAICNAAAIRLAKRGRIEAALRVLAQLRSSGSRCFSSVSETIAKRIAPEGAFENLTLEREEGWERPVTSGIHPIAATRQNEGDHAYSREFMTLQAVLAAAPQGDVDACMIAVEQFAESRSLWLKITAWEKAVVVHEVAKHSKARVAIEIGGYVGYSAMNIARALRPHGGKVASIEVDPLHVCIVRNMVEHAGLTDHVDCWTGYCYDVFPHMLKTYGARSIGMVFMDQKGTRFHTDLNRLKELDLLAEGAVILADNVLKPGAPHYIYELMHGPYEHAVAVSVREFLLQSEDWMVMGFHNEKKAASAPAPLGLHRLAFESDAFRKKSMFDSVAPSKAEWWKFSSNFVNGLERCGSKPRIVGLHGRDNPVIQPEDIARIFHDAGRLS